MLIGDRESGTGEQGAHLCRRRIVGGVGRIRAQSAQRFRQRRTDGGHGRQAPGNQHPEELPQRGRLIEEMERRGADHRVQGTVGEGQLFSRPLAPADRRRTGLGLLEHSIGHIHPVDLVGVQLMLDPGGQNAGAAGDIGNPSHAARAKLSDDLVLCGLIDEALEEGQIVNRRGETPEPRHGIIELATR